MEHTYSKWWLPINVATHGDEVDRLMVFLHIFMFILFAGWGVYFVYCLVKFRAKAGAKARYEDVRGSISKSVEIAVVAIEVVLLVFFSMPVWARVKNEFPKESDAVNVRIVAQQFQWNFHYAGKDGLFGRTKISLIDDTDNPVGLDRSDPAAKDDFVKTNAMTFPAGKPVIMRLTSKDVIHSFKIPVMRFTHDAMPGIEQRIWFEAKTDARLGTYDVECAQLCGIGHTNMRAEARITSQADFDAFLAAEHAKTPAGRNN